MYKSGLKVALSAVSYAYALTVAFSPAQPLLASEDILPNGVFLYGQSSQLNEIGQEYLVFEVQQNRVRGAIYLPYSEFSCFEGTLTQQAMNLSIIDPDNQTTYPLQISLQREAITASVTIPNPIPHLEGYHQLDINIDEVERDRTQEILKTCLSESSI